MLRPANRVNDAPLVFLHCSREAEAFTRQRFDQMLFLARVTDRGPSGI
jgi:hypothetical protein